MGALFSMFGGGRAESPEQYVARLEARARLITAQAKAEKQKAEAALILARAHELNRVVDRVDEANGVDKKKKKRRVETHVTVTNDNDDDEDDGWSTDKESGDRNSKGG